MTKNHKIRLIPFLLPAAGLIMLAACSEIKEQADEKLGLFSNKIEKLDSLINAEMMRVEQLDSLATREMEKIHKMDSIIDSKSSMLDSIFSQ